MRLRRRGGAEEQSGGGGAAVIPFSSLSKHFHLSLSNLINSNSLGMCRLHGDES